MKRLHQTLLLLSLALLSACATAPVAPGCTRIGHDGQFCLLAPALLPPLTATHLVTVQHDDREDTFMGQLQIDSHALRLAGLSLFGTSLFTLEYNGHIIIKHPAQMDLHPELLVAMLELALADPAALRPRLQNLSLNLSQSGDSQIRELFEHGHLIARIVKTAGPLTDAHIDIAIPLAKLAVRMSPLDDHKHQP
ncbi:MAG TPA: DUF3261 domain-containing protein [Gammaproteobacteria bacterium]